MTTEYGNIPAASAPVPPTAGIGCWQTPELRNFGAIQDLTAGGTWYDNEGAKPPSSPGWEFVLP